MALDHTSLNTISIRNIMRVDRNTKPFSSQFDEWINNNKRYDITFRLGNTGQTLQSLGAIESDIVMTSKTVEHIQEHPEMTVGIIKMIPNILEHPSLILNSRNADRIKNNSRIVVFGTVSDKNGAPIAVILDLRPVANNLIIDDLQSVISAYPKNHNPTQFLRDSYVLYVNKKRTPRLFNRMGFQTPISVNQSGPIGSIGYTNNKVKIVGKRFSEVFSERSGFDAKK